MNEAAACAAPDRNLRAPSLRVPAGAVDCHAHVFGPPTQFPFATPRSYTPPESNLKQYLAMLDVCGLDHGVLVQPSVYGSDHGCMLGALNETKGRLRGIVVADPRTLNSRTVDQWSALGVRGIRVNMVVGGGLPLDDIAAMASALAEMDWHLDLIVDRVERLVDLLPTLAKLPSRLVVEQMGRVKGNQSIDTPGFLCLLELLKGGNTWVKLSHAYHISTAGPPYADTTQFARAIVEANPSRVVWGSDWPHPMLDGPMPNDADLVDLLADWIPSPDMRRLALVTNPRQLYGFDRGDSISTK